MTRKEILETIANNSGKPLYIRYGDSSTICMHCPTSKTQLLKNASLIHTVRVAAYKDERPDLKPHRISDPDLVIVTFDATTASGKTLEQVLG